MKMIITCLSLFILLVLFPQTCVCTNPDHICTPSACGNIHNISFPYRLKNDPKHCGHPNFELECENNVSTIMYLNSQKYKVKAINYDNYTIWLADASVTKNNTCFIPNVSLNYLSLDNSPYGNQIFGLLISFMRCPYRLKNDSLVLTELGPHCEASDSSAHTYIILGNMMASDITRDNCSVDCLAWTMWEFRDSKNVSVSEIHDSLLYGFQLTWSDYSFPYSCRWCNGRRVCARNYRWCNGRRVCAQNYPTCSHSLSAMLKALLENMKYPNSPNITDLITTAPGPNRFPAALLIFLLILVVFAGVNLPAMIILGITCAFGFIIIEMNQYRRSFHTYWPLDHFRSIIGLFFAVRFIIVFPCIVWYFVDKFRRRHLSMFPAIEDFLQSENNLMPIRYSYSDIKKMTRSFRNKLGQGGYGTVYKGRLRSGYDVAVKLLSNPGGNGQDFMNEIATIGRIHHVNVVKLVGYCAERSKRALVFDYMSNGSLDKYLYCREETNCLSWERKYVIAIGVGRGIEYLHKGCDVQILHFDIKPHNILLDDNFIPKITDFGLAKFFSVDKSVVTMTAIRGTIGYVAPELINRGFGEVSYKADVYSFGMLLIEMVGLNENLKSNNQVSSQYFPDWIYDCFEQGNDFDIGVTDENDHDGNNGTNREIIKKMTIVALWCIQMNPANRPAMNKVVEMLEGKVERLRVPNRACESAQVTGNDEDESWSTYSTESISLLTEDANPSIEITVED